MFRWSWLLAAGFVMSSALAQTPSQVLHRFFAEEWERGLRESPESASYQGDTRYDDRWSDLDLAAIAAREAADRAALARLRSIDRAALPAADQLHYDTFAWQLANQVERQRFREYLQPISHQWGTQNLDVMAGLANFDDPAAYRRWLARLQALPRLVDQVIVLLAEGLKHGNVPPRVLMERVPPQLAAQVVDDPAQSPFYRPFVRMPAQMPAAERAALQAQAQAVIRDAVVPAYRRLQRAFVQDYLPRTRNSTAAAEGPGGRDYYDFLARQYTTTALTADEIHAIGLKEVERLRTAMEALKARIGYAGTLPQFLEHLRTDPKFFHATPAALLAAYRDLAKRIDPELVKVIRTLPRLPYGVRPIPDNIAADSTTAYYQGGAFDGSRAGYYYVNLFKPEVRPTWEMVPLTLHEAAPGHHTQFARALELPDMPAFRRTAYFVAYGEGWALYAEQLGHEMGLYADPYDHFGQLVYEQWRAVRLVVDTGLHAKGWSRERAIAYMKEHTAKTDQDIVNEIDRYIGTPGQALAYKIGQLKISELRDRAKARLGAKWDLRDFNDAVLATGSVPLAALEASIGRWIDERLKAVN